MPSSFHITSDVSTFKIFWFVAVGSFAADSSLLQPTGECENHTSYVEFSHRITCTRMAQVWVRTHSISCFMCHLMCPSDLFDDSTFLSLLTTFSLLILFFLLPINFIFHDVVDKFPVHSPMRTLAPLSSTTIPQVMNLTTTTSRRLLNRTSRNPPARTGP